MPPLVFLPGAGGRSSFWRPVADRLADLGPTEVFGWPGFGDLPEDPAVDSLAALQRWLLARLPKEPSHLIAQSMGGILAVLLALDEPGRVACLVLAATSGGLDMAGFGAADWRPEYLLSLPHAPDWFVRDRADLGHRLHAVQAPTLLLWSDADPVSPLPVGRALAARIPAARLVTVAGGTHAFANERPDEVAAAIREHLESAWPR